jgi:hypothetical protein
MSEQMPDTYDRLMSALDGLPDVVTTRPSTVRAVTLLGNSETHIVQTMRQRDRGDTIFLEIVSRDGAVRLVIPPAVADTIARQRDALTSKARSKAARAAAQDRKDRGEQPAFLRRKQG